MLLENVYFIIKQIIYNRHYEDSDKKGRRRRYSDSSDSTDEGEPMNNVEYVFIF